MSLLLIFQKAIHNYLDNRCIRCYKDLHIYLNLSPYLNVEEPRFEECNQHKFLTLSLKLFSDVSGKPATILLSALAPIKTRGMLLLFVIFPTFIHDYIGKRQWQKKQLRNENFPLPLRWGVSPSPPLLLITFDFMQPLCI